MNEQNTESTTVIPVTPVKTKRVSKNKVNVNKGANKIKTAAKTISTRAQVAAKNGRVLGRPKGSFGNCSVSLQTLIEKLPVNAPILVSRRWLGMLNLGIETQVVVSTSKNLAEIAQQYKQSSIANVIDLNSPVPVEEALAA